MNRTVTLLASAAVTATLVVGCGSTNTSSNGSSTGSNSGKTMTLRVSWWGDQTRDNITQKVINLYEKLHPDIKIQPEFTGYSGYTQKLSTEAAGNNLPDVMQMNYGPMIAQFASKGLLENLKPYMDDKEIDTSRVDSQILQTGVVNGQQLGVPLGINALAVLYNPSLLKKAGLSDPNPNWTWNDFIQMSEKVHQKLGTYGARTLDPGLAPELYIREHGQHLFNKTQTGLGYSDSVLADYWQINLTLIHDGAAPNMTAVQQIQGLEDEPLAQQKAAFDLRWSNQLTAMSNNGQLNLKLAPPPGPNTDKGLYLKPAMFFSISKNSKYKKQAADFINFFINNLNAAKILGSDRGVPVSSVIRDQLKPSLSKLDQETYDYVDYVAKHSSPIDPDDPANYSEISQDLTDVDQKVLYGKETPAQGAKEFREEATPLLK
ncbi:ABC transporter substrate-binding protein [Alicyclobacillus herbarius]|uniref:ABC transporter substrate-binding protein n=1 Tax=Alicyclobacillus herbarius TaxID=122960 RepID=UPI000410C782|nr:sugar ABC transporter substrate-binding protein [Alicyclobacillus herbarius]